MVQEQMDISEWGMGPFGASHEKTIDHGRVMAAIVLSGIHPVNLTASTVCHYFCYIHLQRYT